MDGEAQMVDERLELLIWLNERSTSKEIYQRVTALIAERIDENKQADALFKELHLEPLEPIGAIGEEQ
jgi:hypothetical protein